jgi:hypothetical protein
MYSEYLPSNTFSEGISELNPDLFGKKCKESITSLNSSPFSPNLKESFTSSILNSQNSSEYSNSSSQSTGNSFSSTLCSDEKMNYIKIPKSSLGYQTNNVYPNYPPLMSDGRAIVATDQSETIINNNLLKDSGVKTNWDYRKYLTDNADKIREINTLEAFNDVGYYKRSVITTNTNVSSQSSQEAMTQRTSSDENDLKQLYKTREELNSRIYSPSISLEN